MNNSFIYTLVLFFSVLFFSVSVADEGKPIIVASTTQIADFARQVAGAHL